MGRPGCSTVWAEWVGLAWQYWTVGCGNAQRSGISSSARNTRSPEALATTN